MRTWTGALLASALSIGASPAFAATGEPIGATLSVINVVTAELGRDTRTLILGDDVHQDEVIDASSDASTELKLNDDTKLAIGAGARLKLDKFVYNGAKANGTIALDLMMGAFRFITGKASKGSYVVRVPTASITVRGTIFDVFVKESGQSWVLLHEGGIKVCNARGECRVHEKTGQLIPISDSGEVGRPERWSVIKADFDVPFDTAFPFVGSPPSIDPDPIYTREALLDEEKDEAPKPERKAEKVETKTVEKADAGDDDYTPPKKPRTSTKTTTYDPTPTRIQLPRRLERPSRRVATVIVPPVKLPRPGYLPPPPPRSRIDHVLNRVPHMVDKIKMRPKFRDDYRARASDLIERIRSRVRSRDYDDDNNHHPSTYGTKPY